MKFSVQLVLTAGFLNVLANPLYEKYITETEISEGCSSVTTGLVNEVINNHFTSNFTVIWFDEFYFSDFKFKVLGHQLRLSVKYPTHPFVRTIPQGILQIFSYLVYDGSLLVGNRPTLITNSQWKPKTFPVKESILYILDAILKDLKYCSVKFGVNKSILEKKYNNEQPSWVIFSSHMEAMDGKTLLISHNSPHLIKDWLITPFATKYMDLVAISDPALYKFHESIHGCEIGLYTHFFHENWAGPIAKIVTSWRKTKFTQNIDLFPNKFHRGFNGAHFVVAVKNQPPFSLKRIEDRGMTVWDGLEVRLISHLSEVLNFSYELRELNEDLYKDGVIETLKIRQATFGIGRHRATEKLYKDFSLSYPHSIDCAAFMSLASTALPKYRAIMGPFLWDVWLALTATYLLAVIPIAFSAWHTIRPLLDDPSELENMFWYVFGTFTNCFTFQGRNSWTKGSKNSTKLFIGTYWIFTIIITACYTGSIIAFITLPVYPEVVDTMHQLLHKNYKIVSLDKEGWWELLSGADDDEASGLAGTAGTVSSIMEGITTVVDSSKEDKPVAFLESSELLTYILKTNYSSSHVGKRKMFHLSSQCFVPMLIPIVLQSHSLYTASINNAIIHAIEAGLLNKFMRDIEWMEYKSSVQNLLQGELKMDAIERQLTLDDTQGMFLLLGGGLATAMCAFVFEVGVWMKNQEGDDITTIAKERFLNISRRVSNALLAPAESHIRLHYPLYFRSDEHSDSLFGSRVDITKQTPGFSDLNLKPAPADKPMRLLSF